MLPRDYRLPPTNRTHPRTTRHFPLYTAKVFASDLPHPRFGFVVSKKVSPSAVERNRVKRQFRGVIENLLPQLKGGYDILFIVRKDALGVDSPNLQTSIRRFLSELDLL